MIWLSIRRQRPALVVLAVLLTLTTVALVVHRVSFDAASRAAGRSDYCLGPGLLYCPNRPGLAEETSAVFATSGSLLLALLLVLPLVAGTVAGAGLFAREFEHGTGVLALTQGVSRLRWWAIGLLAVGLPVAAGVGAVSVVGAWALQNYRSLFTIVSPIGFEISGIVPMVYTLLAFTVAAVAGSVLRSTLGAVGVAVLVQVVVQVVLATELRIDYATPAIARLPLDFTFSSSSAGRTLAQLGWTFGDYGMVDAQGRELDPFCDTPACVAEVGATAYTIRHHPLDRFWPFQLIESGLVLGLAALVVALGTLGLRRRMA